MHLAIVTPYPPNVTGIGQYGYRVSGALARCCALERITLLTEMSPGALAVEQRDGITVERIWRRDWVNTGWNVAARLRQLQPDVVWYNIGASVFGRLPWANLSGLLSPAFTHLSGQASVITLHEMVEQADLRALRAPGGPLARWGARLITLLETQADVICVTLRRHVDWLSLRFPHAMVMHIPHGAFDTPELVADSGNLELLIFATFTPYKGLELLLDAFRDLYARNPALRLTVAGAEHPRFPGYIECVRRQFGDHPAIRWIGYVPEPALRDVFARAALVVLPYTAATGSSSVLHHAVTWGRPIVVSDLAEMRATVEEEDLRAEFFRSGDCASLRAALERMLADSALRAAQANHNYHAVSRMTLDDICRAYVQAFDTALRIRRGGAIAPGSAWSATASLSGHETE